MSRYAACTLAALCAVALCGCGGGGGHVTATIPSGGKPPTVDIYASLPETGPARSQTIPFLRGAELELSERSRAGFFKVNFIPLNDANAAGTWEPKLVAQNALKATDDPSTIYYIGDWASGANQISIPILNQAGVPQVSPASTYVGLTTGAPGPSGMRTFLRLVPPASVEADADLQALKLLHCGETALAHDSDQDGNGIAEQIALHGLRNFRIVSYSDVDASSPRLFGWVASLKRLNVDCVLYAGSVAEGAAKVAALIHRDLPNVKILGTDGVCTQSWAADLPMSSDSALWCSSPTPKLSATPIGANFLALYKAKYGVSNPDPYAVYGYEAMKLGLDVIASLGSNGNIKSDVVKALFAIHDRSSAIGTYSFDRYGDISLSSYSLYRFTHGAPTFERAIPPGTS